MASAATALRRAVLERAKTHPRVARLDPFNVFPGYGYRRSAPKGYPDCSGYTIDGRAIFLEIKGEDDDERNTAQREFLETARAYGCIAGYVRSVQDFEELMG